MSSSQVHHLLSLIVPKQRNSSEQSEPKKICLGFPPVTPYFIIEKYFKSELASSCGVSHVSSVSNKLILLFSHDFPAMGKCRELFFLK